MFASQAALLKYGLITPREPINTVRVLLLIEICFCLPAFRVVPFLSPSPKAARLKAGARLAVSMRPIVFLSGSFSAEPRPDTSATIQEVPTFPSGTSPTCLSKNKPFSFLFFFETLRKKEEETSALFVIFFSSCLHHTGIVR